ncbi:MAG: DUF721 domain-containing protein [Planctomycetes bacterium]|nr:DUF721 domain-containing protein [Planctomycetota bacterium]
MNDAQFQTQFDNSRYRGPQPLGESHAVASILHRITARSRAFEEADRVWRDVAPAEWLKCTRIDRVEKGEMVVAVSDPVLRYHLQQAAVQLGQAAARVSAVVNRIRFELDRDGGQPEVSDR